jgi:hypothetical protein
MKRALPMKCALSMAALAACIWWTPARAELEALDDVPAATLLLPYFEVDIQDPNGAETVFSIHNVDPGPVLAHLTLWTDRAIPTLAFDVYLTPYDVEEINLRDIFDGRYPNASVLSCDGEPTQIAGSLEDTLAGTTGQPLERLDGLCAGSSRGDGVARGYLTIDAVRCEDGFPAGTGGVAGIIVSTPANVLWGDYRLVHRTDGVAVGELLVALERVEAGQESFPRIWGARYLAVPGAHTDLIIWRDVNSNGSGFECGPPTTAPAPEGGIVIFDDAEDAFEPVDGLPELTAARVRVGTDLMTPYTSGWIYLNLERLGTEGGYVTALQFTPPVGVAIRGVDLSAGEPTDQ